MTVQRDVILVSKVVAEQAVLMGVKNSHSIETVYLKMALKREEVLFEKVPLSKTSTVSSTIRRLSTDHMTFKNIIYPVFNDSIACEDLWIGLPALWHSRLDTRTLFEGINASLHGTSCLLVGSDTVKTGKLDLIMTARSNDLPNDDPNLAQMTIKKVRKYFIIRFGQRKIIFLTHHTWILSIWTSALILMPLKTPWKRLQRSMVWQTILSSILSVPYNIT